MAVAFVALGSNLGDRTAHLDHARERVGSLGELSGGSPIYETAPVGGPADQGPYLNAVLQIATDLPPRRLLDDLLAIERERGRTRDVPWGPRTLDLDLLWYDGRTIDEPGLVVPHPGIRMRPFVLAPLTDLAPWVADADGPYSDAYPSSGAPGVERLTGPLHPDGSRWMVGLADALDLTSLSPGRFSGHAHPDWSNTSGDTFGGFLIGLALESCKSLIAGGVPSHLTYRFLRTVASDAMVDIDVVVDRQSPRSVDATVSFHVSGELAGTCAVAMLAHPTTAEWAPPAPRVMGRSSCIPATELVRGTGRVAGMSAHSWTSLQRWDVPDLIDGTQAMVRSWTPNVVFGSDDLVHHAVAAVMPIDALIWPATLERMGLLPDQTQLSTPTIELSARFAEISRDAWFLGEAIVDHVTDRSVAGTVRVWGADDRFVATGHSLNLLRR